jgi:hypothetical protein
MFTSPRLSRGLCMIREAASGRPPGAALLSALCLLFVAAAVAARPCAAGEGLAERLPAAVAEAQKLVEKDRGVSFGGPVASAVLPEKELIQILGKKLAEDLPVPFDRYAASLAALGLVPPEADLKSRMLRLYARQVAGFYDPDEKKFFIVPERSEEAARSAAGFGPLADRLLEQALLTHELTHALQDRRLDLVPRMKALRENSDGALALQAFLEGEATVVMMDVLLRELPPEARALTSTDQLLSSMAQLAAGGLEGAEDVPEYFVKELLFPYTAGTAWVEGRRAAGGWAAIDADYDRPPETTAEILDPSRYRAPRKLLPFAALPSSEDLPPQARPLYLDRLGAFTLRSLLEEAGSDTAAELAAWWQDDRILFYETKGRPRGPVGFVWSLRLATPEAARTLAARLGPFYRAAAPGEARVHADGDVVRVERRPASAAWRSGSARPRPLTEGAGASSPPAGR